MQASVVDVLEPQLPARLSELRLQVQMQRKKVKMKLKEKEDGECVGLFVDNPVVVELG